MENQPATTGRQWLRLASLARLQAGQDPIAPTPPAPAPAPAPTTTPPRPTQAPVPRIPFSRPQAEPAQAQPQTLQPQIPLSQQTPTSSTANGAPSAQPQPQPPPRRQATPPPLPPVSQSSPRSRVPQAPTPPESPRVIKPSSPTPPESPKTQQLQPVKAPPPQYPDPEPEPKPLPAPSTTGSVKTISDINGKPPANGNQSPVDARAPPPTPSGTGMATAWKKKDDNSQVKIITMAGENMGTFMELGSSHSRHTNRKQQHGYQLQHQTKDSESQSVDGKSEDKKKAKDKKSAAKGQPIATLVNSNVQSVNNSILFRSSCTQQSPGVHFTLVSQRQNKHKGSPQ